MVMAFSAHNEISRVKTFLYGINSGNEKGNTTSDYYTICPYFVLFSFYKTIIFPFSFLHKEAQRNLIKRHKRCTSSLVEQKFSENIKVEFRGLRGRQNFFELVCDHTTSTTLFTTHLHFYYRYIYIFTTCKAHFYPYF